MQENSGCFANSVFIFVSQLTLSSFYMFWREFKHQKGLELELIAPATLYILKANTNLTHMAAVPLETGTHTTVTLDWRQMIISV